MTEAGSLYRTMVAEGDDPTAPERVRVERRGDRAVVTLDEPKRLNVLSAPLVRQLRRALATSMPTPMCDRSCSPAPIRDSAPGAI